MTQTKIGTRTGTRERNRGKRTGLGKDRQGLRQGEREWGHQRDRNSDIRTGTELQSLGRASGGRAAIESRKDSFLAVMRSAMVKHPRRVHSRENCLC